MSLIVIYLAGGDLINDFFLLFKGKTVQRMKGTVMSAIFVF